MSTTAQHLNARNDPDLQNRFTAMAEMKGIPNASGWVASHISQLVTQEVESSQAVSDVHAYAKETRDSYIAAIPPPPGQNLGAVTDAHLATAIDLVYEAPVE